MDGRRDRRAEDRRFWQEMREDGRRCEKRENGISFSITCSHVSRGGGGRRRWQPAISGTDRLTLDEGNPSLASDNTTTDGRLTWKRVSLSELRVHGSSLCVSVGEMLTQTQDLTGMRPVIRRELGMHLRTVCLLEEGEGSRVMAW